MFRCFRHRSGLSLLVFLVLATASPLSAQPEGANLDELEERAFKEAAAVTAPSIVRIQTVGGLDRVNDILTVTGPTSGVVVSPDGYIVSSAFNFISRPSSILVQLPDDRRFPAQVIATDRLKMITLLKIDAENLTPIEAAPKDSITVGLWAIALGRTYDSPLPSISVGIVSATNRIWGKAIQTDAKVSPVNYGGPLVDIQGRTMGLLVPLSPDAKETTAGVEWYDSGIGFAIPMEDVYAVVEQLKQGEDLHPGLMGIGPARGGGLADEPKIDFVRVESPAEKAGLEAGDLLEEVGGRQITRWDDMKFALGTRYAGDTIDVTVRRGDETISTEVTLVKELLPYESGYLGILPARESRTDQPAAGVGIRHVFDDSPAAAANIEPRDRITAVNGEAVASADALRQLIARIRPGQTATVEFTRDGQANTAEVTLSAFSTEPPAELRTAVIESPSSPDDAAEDDGPKTGRYTVELPEPGGSYWAYVPDDYNPEYQYGLMVWVHPQTGSMEAEIFNRWQSICERRGIILIGPKASEPRGWTVNDAEFVHDAVERLTTEYTIDPERIFLHSVADGGRFAYHLAFKYRETFRGIAAVNQPLITAPPENKPDASLQFLLLHGSDERMAQGIETSVQVLQRMKYPVSASQIDGGGRDYLSDEPLDRVARWADSLDRI